jgi:site-specific recombinase XerD
VLCQDTAEPLTRQIVQTRVKRAARKAGLSQAGVHILRHHADSRIMPTALDWTLVSAEIEHLSLTRSA